MRFVTVIVSLLIYIVAMNLFRQIIIDRFDQVFHSAYLDTQWYLMSPKIRRIILLIMIRSTNQTNLTAGKMAEVSSESAAIVSITTILSGKNKQFFDEFNTDDSSCFNLIGSIQKGRPHF